MTDSIPEQIQIYNDLYDTLRHNSGKDVRTSKFQKKGNSFRENFFSQNEKNRVLTSLLISTSTRMDLETFFFLECIAKPGVLTKQYYTALELWSIKDTEMHQHWSQGQITVSEDVSLLQMQYASLIYGTKEDKEKFQQDEAKRKKISRLLKPYLKQGIESKKSKGYEFIDWSFFESAILGTIQDKINELVGKTRLVDDLLKYNPLAKIALEIEHHQGLCVIDVNNFTHANIDYIRSDPNDARDKIKEILISKLTLSEEQQRSLIIQLYYDLEEDCYDDIFNLEGKQLVCFTGTVSFIKKVKRRYNHLFSKVSVEFNGSSVSQSLSSTPGKLYFRQSQLKEFREYNGLYKIIAIINMIKEDDKNERSFELDIMSLNIPPSDKPVPVQSHIEKYRQRMKEVGFDQNLSDLLATVPLEDRELMIKAVVLSMASNFDKHGRAVHTLIIGDPGQGKSKLIEWIRKYIKCANYIPCEGSSDTLVSRAIQEGKKYRLVKGPFADNYGEYILADEFQTAKSESLSDILNLMSAGETLVNKYSFKTMFYSKRPIIAMGNPAGEKTGIERDTQFDLSRPLIDQFGISSNVKRRFDLKVAVSRRDHSIETALRMRKNVWMRRYHNESHNTVYTPEEFCSIFWEVKGRTPEFSEQALQTTSNWCTQNSSENAHLVTDSIHRIAVQFAKFRLSDTIEVEDLSRARDVMAETVMTHQRREE